jgi:hypothetical protein
MPDFAHLQHVMQTQFPDLARLAQGKRLVIRPPMPVVVGVEWSGTTLLSMMLDAHPLLAVPPETGFILAIVEREDSGRSLTPDQLFEVVTSSLTWDDFGVSREAYGEALRALQPFSVTAGVRAFYELYARQRGKTRWGDKTPIYGRSLVKIEQILPEARFIHLIRDGRDVALSLRKTSFAPAQDMPGLAAHWRDQLESTRYQGARCRYYHEVRYEELVARPEKVLRSICQFVEIPFHHDMLRYYRWPSERLGAETPTRPRGDESFVLVHERRLETHRLATQPPQTCPVGAWRQAMSPAERQAFESVAGDLLRLLGYET